MRFARNPSLSILITAIYSCMLRSFGVGASRKREPQSMLNWTSDYGRNNSYLNQVDNSSLKMVSRRKRSVDLFSPQRRGGLICSLCVVVDRQFIESHQLVDHSSVVSTVYKMFDKVSWAFRNIDWNDDGIPDNFGFDIISLVTSWDPYPDEELGEYNVPKPSLDLLAKFAETDFTPCCLGIGITNRPFQENQVGVSFIASQKLLGGICDHRNSPPPILSPNSALISGIGIQGSLLSLKDVETILLHEVGHAFGVLRHDKDIVKLGSPECSGFLQGDVVPADYLAESVEPPNGRYIMWGQELQGSSALKLNHLQFSPCSRRAVMEVFRTQEGRSSCLKKDETPFCGNGRLEHPEECDCGNEISCNKDRCCGPRGSTAPCKLFKGINPNDCVLTTAVKKPEVKDSLGPSLHAPAMHYRVVALFLFVLRVNYFYIT